MLQLLLSRLSPYMLYLRLVALFMLIVAGWYARGIYERAQASKKLDSAIESHLSQEKLNQAIGLNLETGLNDYKNKTQELDRKVPDATIACRFDVDGVQRTAERIATGIAARKRSF